MIKSSLIVSQFFCLLINLTQYKKNQLLLNVVDYLIVFVMKVSGGCRSEDVAYIDNYKLWTLGGL